MRQPFLKKTEYIHKNNKKAHFKEKKTELVNFFYVKLLWCNATALHAMRQFPVLEIPLPHFTRWTHLMIG